MSALRDAGGVFYGHGRRPDRWRFVYAYQSRLDRIAHESGIADRETERNVRD